MDKGGEMNMGCILGQRLVKALTLHGVPYDTLVSIVYGELDAIAKEQEEGDFLEFPDGTNYTKTFSPKRKGL